MFKSVNNKIVLCIKIVRVKQYTSSFLANLLKKLTEFLSKKITLLAENAAKYTANIV